VRTPLKNLRGRKDRVLKKSFSFSEKKGKQVEGKVSREGRTILSGVSKDKLGQNRRKRLVGSRAQKVTIMLGAKEIKR